MAVFKSDAQRRLFDAVTSELEGLGYRDDLICRDYPFTDWFQPGDVRRNAPIAAFGQTPTTYESACLAVALANGRSGPDLAADFRALGATRVFEVHEDRISVWRIGRTISPQDEELVILPERLEAVFAEHADAWRAEAVLRAKAVGTLPGQRQLDFFDLGLIPALEVHIREKLNVLLSEALAQAARAYGKSLGSMNPAETQKLFRLVFRFLAAKVLHDRGIPGFDLLTSTTDSAVILERVGEYYGRSDEILDDPAVGEAVKSVLWGRLNFQNLSVEVLAYVYEFTLVSHSLRKRLGIHGTPPSIARYIVRNLPIERFAQEERVVVEPCSGHAVFLVAALQRLRDLLPPDMDRATRHQYFVRMLQGFEIDTFAFEVSLLCLMLADFPNPNGWRLVNTDVFTSGEFVAALRQARIVLCNPPYEDIPVEKRQEYGDLRSVRKPEELLHRVLDYLHPDGLLGFVLPRRVLDDRSYAAVRRRIAERYSIIEVVDLPESRVFYVSEHKSILLLTKKVSDGSGFVEIVTTEFEKADQERFLNRYSITRKDSYRLSVEEAAETLAVPALQDVWQVLSHHEKLGDMAEVHRGIEWRAYVRDEQRYSDTERENYERGYGRADAERLVQFQPPGTTYLYVNEDDLLWQSYQNNPWQIPKVFVNAVRMTRKGRWRHVAFIDDEGLIASQNFHGLWPRSALLPIEVLASILNGPVAAAFVTAHEGGKHNTKDVLKSVPLPTLGDGDRERLTRLVRRYMSSLAGSGDSVPSGTSRETLLEIDAVVLRGYRLPLHLEKKLLAFFEGVPRPVPFPFNGYSADEFFYLRLLRIEEDFSAAWEAFNSRRVELIKKKRWNALDPAEAEELRIFQGVADHHLDLTSPLNFQILDQLKEAARRDGIKVGF